MNPSITQKKTQDLITYAEERGWVLEDKILGAPTLSGRPRFSLIFTRKKSEPLLTIYSLQLFIGSGRVHGFGYVHGLGSDSKTKIGNWFEAGGFLKSHGIPTEADREEEARLRAAYVAEDPGLLRKV